MYSTSTAAVVLMTTFAIMQNHCLFSLKLAINIRVNIKLPEATYIVVFAVYFKTS